MTTLVSLAAVRRLPPSRRDRIASQACALGFALALTLVASRAAAQVPPPSPPPPLPPQGAPTAAPVVRRPQAAPPPSTVAPSGVPAARVAARAPTAAPLRAPARGSALPADSLRPASRVTTAAPPANAVAQCADGAFIVAPGDAGACAAHRGLRVIFPRRADPRSPVAAARAVPAPAARAAAPADPVAPAGATMRCKDGTYLTGTPAESRCDGLGGVAVLLVVPRTAPPPRPRRP